ncbi:MAG: hypothetical protein EZS28_025842 [Streblomastix strix]|uniref:Cleavage/polyadenylation specificity factor A subunit C-terminal domain-containing protein n=1 Tax=Streblomastix strix TaxID=222440 RepID=A0A5J4V864_9EUKA|nr:MAG: hypothetical protein EZS28_025842 [Streblomastix strix]
MDAKDNINNNNNSSSDSQSQQQQQQQFQTDEYEDNEQYNPYIQSQSDPSIQYSLTPHLPSILTPLHPPLSIIGATSDGGLILIHKLPIQMEIFAHQLEIRLSSLVKYGFGGLVQTDFRAPWLSNVRHSQSSGAFDSDFIQYTLALRKEKKEELSKLLGLDVEDILMGVLELVRMR